MRGNFPKEILLCGLKIKSIVLWETISVRGVGGQTKCNGTPPRLLWIWPQNISVNAVRQMSLASERCLPRAEWHFLGTIWDCSDIENIPSPPTRCSSVVPLLSSLFPSLPLSANFPGPECCSKCLLPFHSVTGQKTWQSSKSLVALHRGMEGMKMWLGSAKENDYRQERYKASTFSENFIWKAVAVVHVSWTSKLRKER